MIPDHRSRISEQRKLVCGFCDFFGNSDEIGEHIIGEHADAMVWSLSRVKEETLSAFSKSIACGYENVIGEWLGNNLAKAVLLYSARRSELSIDAWHGACDGRGPTITIACCNGGDLIDGFTRVRGSRQGGWKGDSSNEAFVFALRNGRSDSAFRMLQMPGTTEVVQHSPHWAAIFGGFAIAVDARAAIHLVTGPPKWRYPEGRPRRLIGGRRDESSLEHIETWLWPLGEMAGQ
jgi:hypothetical protein